MPDIENGDQPQLWTKARTLRFIGSLVILAVAIYVVVIKFRTSYSGNPRKELAATSPVAPSLAAGSWRFIVSGDSRNCGDVVMPTIAAQSAAYAPVFYWHLGDLRAIYTTDEDMRAEFAHRQQSLSCQTYHRLAWSDFIDHQIAPFGDTPFYAGIGNHETFKPKTAAGFEHQFADWLSSPTLVSQRVTDGDRNPEAPSTYYHWIHDGVDFIYLDNSCGHSPDIYPNCDFFPKELKWFDAVLARAKKNLAVNSVVVGMHEALPGSVASDHSMCEDDNDAKKGKNHKESCESGQHVYDALLDLQKVKPVYILASHSHFYMAGIFDKLPESHRIPGWIVGTGGAARYPLPDGVVPSPDAIPHAYGFLLATVDDKGKIKFEFKEVKEADVPAYVKARYDQDLVPWCFAHNAKADNNVWPQAPDCTK